MTSNQKPHKNNPPAIINAMGVLFFSVFRRHKPKIEEDHFGINFVGFAKAEMGLGQSLRMLVSTAFKAEIPIVIRDIKPDIQSQQTNLSVLEHLDTNCKYGINCICINPDVLYLLPRWLNISEWREKYNIGYWFWELSNYPKTWRYATKIVDEIWVNTDYVAHSMKKSGLPVFKIPFSISLDPPNENLNRSHFNLDEDSFLYLFSYDILSSSGRKNPEAVIESFLEAFPEPDPTRVGLIIKSINGKTAPDKLKALHDRFSADPRICFIDESFETEEMLALLACCDCYISLHRAEGLGLGMAESMFLGKPVIATGYSGNMEFMNENNSFLVPYTLVPVSPEDYPNSKNELWADPDAREAAVIIRKVFEDQEHARLIGKNAAAYMREHHSPTRAGKVITERLESIKRACSEKTTKRIPRSALILIQRGLQALISLISMGFIAQCLSSEAQGWYYAFLSMASLYTLADLGLSVALVPYFARSFATTQLKRGGQLEGKESALLSERLQESMDWYAVLSVLYILIVLPMGSWFFERLPSLQEESNWLLPWTALVFGCAGQLLLMPILAFIEGAGKVRLLTKVRLLYFAIGGIVCWTLLYSEQGLWAASALTLSGDLLQTLWLVIKWPGLLAILKKGIGRRFSFSMAISSIQWRIGISWICAFLSSQIYGLILMRVQDAVVSGQLALTMAITNMIGVLALSSIAGKAAFVGQDAARNDFQKIRLKFRHDIIFYMSAFALGASLVLFLLWLIEDSHYALRLLPFWETAGLLVFTFVTNLMIIFATYVRSYLREPFMWVNVLGTVLTITFAYWGALTLAATGVVAALAGIALLITLPLTLTVWRSEMSRQNSMGGTGT
jgi:glycosyltransferase involved in cell wall biosynthesis